MFDKNHVQKSFQNFMEQKSNEIDIKVNELLSFNYTRGSNVIKVYTASDNYICEVTEFNLTQFDDLIDCMKSIAGCAFNG